MKIKCNKNYYKYVYLYVFTCVICNEYKLLLIFNYHDIDNYKMRYFVKERIKKKW